MKWLTRIKKLNTIGIAIIIIYSMGNYAIEKIESIANHFREKQTVRVTSNRIPANLDKIQKSHKFYVSAPRALAESKGLYIFPISLSHEADSLQEVDLNIPPGYKDRDYQKARYSKLINVGLSDDLESLNDGRYVNLILYDAKEGKAQLIFKKTTYFSSLYRHVLGNGALEIIFLGTDVDTNGDGFLDSTDRKSIFVFSANRLQSDRYDSTEHSIEEVKHFFNDTDFLLSAEKYPKPQTASGFDDIYLRFSLSRKKFERIVSTEVEEKLAKILGSHQ